MRDRRAVAICAAALAAAAGWLAGWEPAADAVPRLQRELPQDRERLAQMQTLANEAARLQALPDIGKRAPADLRNDIAKSLETAGIADALVEVSDTMLRVRADDVSFYTWMQWLSSARKTFGVAVEGMDVKKAVGKETGIVAVSVELRLPGP